MRLNLTPGEKLYQQIFQQIRDSIEGGINRPGEKLPPIRALAAELGCSRNTVETAYRLLVQEGYARSHVGSGYVVEDPTILHADPGNGAWDETKAERSADGYGSGAPLAQRPADGTETQSQLDDTVFDFTYGNLQTGTFPAAAWRAITNDLLASAKCASADCYTDPLGEMDLRRQIARQLNGSRGIACTPEQVVVQGGTESSVMNLLALFDREHDDILMEDPGYNGIRNAFLRSGFSVAPVDVEGGLGNFVRCVAESHARLLFVTPSSQFPTCKAMSEDVRRVLLTWATRTDAYILEDDYCREFRYRERPIAPLASMDDTGRVIYMGTFSKALSPALRINYLVLPPRLLEQWRGVFAHSYPAVPWLTQATLARFMESGLYDRHLRKVQAQNRRKYEALSGAITRYMGQRVAVRENGTGLHLLVDVLDGRDQDELVTIARDAGVIVYPTRAYCMRAYPSMRSCILIGFSAICEEQIDPGIARLSQAWFG